MADSSGTGPGVVEFAALPWLEEGPRIHSRAAAMAGDRCAVVRYGPGAARDEWCTDGHRGYVIEGRMTYELATGERLEVPPQAGFWLPPGLGHRGVNGSEETLVFLVDVPDDAGERGEPGEPGR